MNQKTDTFTCRVYDELAAQGYNQAQGLAFLAGEMGKSKSAVKALLNTHKNPAKWPGDVKVFEYARALGMTPSQLMRTGG